METSCYHDKPVLAAIENLEIISETAAVDLDDLPYNTVRETHEGIEAAQNLCHFLAARSGWWTDLQTGLPKIPEAVNIPEKLMLIVSEVAEAMEGDRKDLQDDKLPHRKMLEVELADALIRICDLAGYLKLDLAGAVIEKLAFNQKRADHSLAQRQQAGGKAY